MAFVHANVYDNGTVYIYTKEKMNLKRFDHQSDAVIYLQNQGFKIAAVSDISLWFVKEINE